MQLFIFGNELKPENKINGPLSLAKAPRSWWRVNLGLCWPSRRLLRSASSSPVPAGAARWVLGDHHNPRRLVRDHHLLVQDRHGAGAGGRRHGARGGPQPRGDEGGGEGGDPVQIALLCFRISHFGISSETHLANTNIKMNKTWWLRQPLRWSSDRSRLPRHSWRRWRRWRRLRARCSTMPPCKLSRWAVILNF